jgi:Tol biopolymer transport system component
MKAKTLLAIWASATFIAMGATIAQSALPSASAFKVTETQLGLLDAQMIAPVYSTDGLHLAYVAHRNAGECMVLDGQSGPVYDEIGQDGAIYSHESGSKQVAYAARIAAKWRVVTNGKAGPEFDGIEWLDFSPDGNHMVYTARTNQKWSLVVDGNVGTSYDEIDTVLFSDNSQHVAYRARTGQKWCLVVDRQAGAAYDDIVSDQVVLSSGGTRVAYVAKIGQKFSMVVDGVAGPVHDIIPAVPPIFSADGTRVAYIASQTTPLHGFAVVADGNTAQVYDLVTDVAFSPDSKHLMYVATGKMKQFLVRDGRPFPAHDHINKVVCSTDGQHVACVAMDGPTSPGSPFGSWSVETDGKSGPSYSGIGNSLIFTPDDRDIVYSAQTDDQKWSVIVGTQMGKPHDACSPDDPVFSPNGKRLAYVVEDSQKWLVVVDAKFGASYDQIGEYHFFGETVPTFSADSKHVAYEAVTGKRRVVVLDGQGGPEYDAIGGRTPKFTADDALEFLAIKNNSLYRVKYGGEAGESPGN